jgi:hypothetical protein
MSVIIGTTGRVTKGLKKNLEAIPGKYSVDVRQLYYEHHTQYRKYCSLQLEP